MNRTVRSSLFALGILVGSAVVFFVGKSTNEPQAEAAWAENGGDSEWLAALARVHAVQEAPQHGVRVDLQAGPEPELDEPELDDDARLARSREQAKLRVERLTALAAREAIDPDWGPATEQQMAERFAVKAPAGFKLISTSCKTSICIAEVETPSREASTGLLGWPRLFGLPQGYTYHRGEEGGGFRSVAFLARDGHSLPD